MNVRVVKWRDRIVCAFFGHAWVPHAETGRLSSCIRCIKQHPKAGLEAYPVPIRQPKHSADSPVEPLSHEPNGDDEVRVECLQCDEVFDGLKPFKCPNCGGDNPLDFSVVDRQTERQGES